MVGIKRPSSDALSAVQPEAKRKAAGGAGAASAAAAVPDAVNRPLDKVHCDAIVNYLLRLACQVSRGCLLMLTLVNFQPLLINNLCKSF